MTAAAPAACNQHTRDVVLEGRRPETAAGIRGAGGSGRVPAQQSTSCRIGAVWGVRPEARWLRAGWTSVLP